MSLRNLVFHKGRMVIAWSVLAGLALLPYLNCSSVHEQYVNSSSLDSTQLLSSLRSQAYSIFANKCASCHNTSTTDNDLKSFEIEDLEDNNYIKLGSPQTSLLYLMLVDRIMPPADNPQLNDSEIAVIRDWIAVEGGNFDTYIGGTPIDESGNDVSFTQVRTILTQNCTNCHRAGGEPPRLDVDAATLRAAVFNGQRLVIPNNASGSLLLNSLSSMPTGQPLGLNSPAANTIRAWINSGAL